MSLAQLFYLKESIRHRVRRRFPRKAVHRSSRFTMESLENRLLLSATPVAPDLSNVITNAINLEPNPITQAASPNQVVSFQLDYQHTGTAASNGLGLRIHYDSRQLRPGEAGADGQFGTADDIANLTNLISVPTSTLFQGIQDQPDTQNFDNNTGTDRFVLIAWADLQGAFPKGPAALFIANWTTTANFTGTTINFTKSSPATPPLNATSAQFTLAQQDVDTDLDGVFDRIEVGDNNNDGIQDSQQANVASLLDFSGANRLTFFTDTAGTFFANMQAVATPAGAPAGVTLPFGAFSYEVKGVTPGNGAKVRIILPTGNTVNNLYKFGSETGNTTPHWYSFDFDAATRTGFTFSERADVVELFFRDGQRGDSDLAANGTIVDPIAPAVDPNATGLIAGTVWNDANKNGLFDQTEPGANGWKVFIDQNRNGVLDQGEPTSLTADSDLNSDGLIIPTDETGIFFFDNLAPGNYRLGLVLDQPGWGLTFPPQGPFIDVVLTAGATNVNNLFGVAQNLPTLQISGASILEGDGGTQNMAFTVSFSGGSATPVTVQYATAPNTALAGSDYQTTSGTLTFTPGTTPGTQQILVPIVGDLIFEPTEDFTVSLSNAVGATIVGALATGTIIDNDPQVLPSVSISNVTLAEGTSLAGFTAYNFLVTLSTATTNTVTVLASTQDFSATAASGDYTAVTNQLVTFAPGETSKTVTVQVRQDDLQESDEVFFVTLAQGNNNSTITQGTATGTITNDDTHSIAIGNRTLAEGTSLAGFTAYDFVVTLTGATIQSNVEVLASTQDFSATAASGDYTAVTNQLVTFAPGETSRRATKCSL
jgi:hypothetical protein